MDKYYYINVVFSSNESKAQFSMEAVVVNKCHALKHCPIISMRRAILNEPLSGYERAIKDFGKCSMKMSCCEEIDFSEYRSALEAKISTVTINPMKKE